eukprot:COSAG01_NODE_60338_length_295_cov_0.913265_1_plen_20_part_10
MDDGREADLVRPNHCNTSLP